MGVPYQHTSMERMRSPPRLWALLPKFYCIKHLEPEYSAPLPPAAWIRSQQTQIEVFATAPTLPHCVDGGLPRRRRRRRSAQPEGPGLRAHMASASPAVARALLRARPV